MARSGEVKGRRRRAVTRSRPERWRFYQHLILIVCEGKTEKQYFEAIFADLPKDTVFVRPVDAGRDPLGVAEQAIVERGRLQREANNREVDEVWLAFDKDDADLEAGKTLRFEQALQLAASENMHLAFSNEAFELWLLLHFNEINATAPISRQTLYDSLGEILCAHPLFATVGYDHKKSKVDDVIKAFFELEGDTILAHGRAESLLIVHGEKPLLATNPSTRVHMLLQSLRSWVEYYTPYSA